MQLYLWIALGSALGGMARYACDQAAIVWLGPALPWGTLLVNVVGSFVIGVAAHLTTSADEPLLGLQARGFVMVGLCGGFTTFSAFSLQNLVLLRAGATGRAALYVALSVGLCLAAALLGAVLARRVG